MKYKEQQGESVQSKRFDQVTVYIEAERSDKPTVQKRPSARDFSALVLAIYYQISLI